MVGLSIYMSIFLMYFGVYAFSILSIMNAFITFHRRLWQVMSLQFIPLIFTRTSDRFPFSVSCHTKSIVTTKSARTTNSKATLRRNMVFPSRLEFLLGNTTMHDDPVDFSSSSSVDAIRTTLRFFWSLIVRHIHNDIRCWWWSQVKEATREISREREKRY